MLFYVEPGQPPALPSGSYIHRSRSQCTNQALHKVVAALFRFPHHHTHRLLLPGSLYLGSDTFLHRRCSGCYKPRAGSGWCRLPPSPSPADVWSPNPKSGLPQWGKHHRRLCSFNRMDRCVVPGEVSTALLTHLPGNWAANQSWRKPGYIDRSGCIWIEIHPHRQPLVV